MGRPEFKKFVGALRGKRAKKGVFITTGSFSLEAIVYVEHIDPTVVLIDSWRLTELMIDFNIGISTAAIYRVKRVDSDYSDEAVLCRRGLIVRVKNQCYATRPSKIPCGYPGEG